MAKVNNHKMALLYMMRELLLKTDEEHVLNATVTKWRFYI